MAKQTILEIEEYSELFQGKEISLETASFEEVYKFQREISNCLRDKLEVFFQNRASSLQCYFLGSYARSEATYYSDIDMLISGDEGPEDQFREAMANEGLPVRARRVKDLPNLKEIDPITLMSFLRISLTEHSSESLNSLRKDLLVFISKKPEYLIQSLRTENEKRRQSYDSISNYLEPNLKFQPGGLRDLEQANILLEHFRVLGVGAFQVKNLLGYYKSVLLLVRQYLHTKIKTDVLLAPFQQEVAEYFGFEDIRSFMSFLQNICSESSFLCSWLFKVAGSGELQSDISGLDLVMDVSLSAEKRGDIRWRKKIRDFLSSEEASPESFFDHPSYSEIKSLVSSNSSGLEDFLFESKIFDFLLPDFARVRYLVQHDQYHRYTVGAHSLVCIRNLFRMIDGTFHLRYFSGVLSEMRAKDFSVLFYTALFHDLGKGLDEEHSIAGQKIVEKYLPRLSGSKDLVREVKWMVSKHLLFSKIAFRTNLSSAATYQRMKKEELTEARVKRLMIFTLVDIASSNPEALTDWKESLLFELYTKWIEPENRFDLGFTNSLLNKVPGLNSEIFENLDLDLLSSIGEEKACTLVKSFVSFKDSYFFDLFELEPGRFLITYMDSKPEKGLLNSLLNFLVSLGFQLEKINANSSDLKVFDLFVVTDNRPKQVLNKLLATYKRNITDIAIAYPVNAKWSFFNESQWLVKVEGRLIKEILLGLTNELYLRSIDIDWVNIYKWGRQNEVVIGLSAGHCPAEEWIENKLEF